MKREHLFSQTGTDNPFDGKTFGRYAQLAIGDIYQDGNLHIVTVDSGIGHFTLFPWHCPFWPNIFLPVRQSHKRAKRKLVRIYNRPDIWMRFSFDDEGATEAYKCTPQGDPEEENAKIAKELTC